MVCLFMICGLCACKGDEQNSTLKEGTYISIESAEGGLLNNLVLEDNSFKFMYSALSSHIPCGSYEIKGNKLILTEVTKGDKKSTFVFKIDEENLIFQKNESTALPEYSEVKDGAVFVYLKDMTKK